MTARLPHERPRCGERPRPAYERWAKVYNLKQMAAALQYLKEHQLFEYDDLAAKTDAATERFHTLAGNIQQIEAELLGGEKLPKMDVLKEKRRQLAARKKALYLEYRKAQQDMRELVAVKGSVDHLRGLTDNQRNKEQAR